LCFKNYTKVTSLSEEYALGLHFIAKPRIKEVIDTIQQTWGYTYANLLTNVTHVCVVCCTWVMAKTIERFIRELDVQFSKYLIKDAMGECLFLILDVSRCNNCHFLTFGGLERILLHFTSMRTI